MRMENYGMDIENGTSGALRKPVGVKTVTEHKRAILQEHNKWKKA
jgi:hypothetical protein